MKYSLWLAFLFALGLAVLLPSRPALAQSCDGNCPEPREYESERPDNRIATGSGVRVSRSYTKSIVRIIAGANDTCDSQINLRYRIDCLRVYYGWVADSLPDTGDYVPIKEAMRQAEAKLDAIVRANLDPSAPTMQPREAKGTGGREMPFVRPVKKERATAAATQAAAVVEETELIILRSGGDPARRTQHYTEVAAAVEDNLVILRSA
jgi:hypothetical protein